MAYSAPEPLRDKHRLEKFSCGEDSLDLWLGRYARHADGARSAKVFVTTAGEGRVAGYYALSVGEVRAADGTERLKKGRPAGRPVPVAILGRLAVDRRDQGRGVGRSLLLDAVARVASVAEQVGIRALVVHAVSDEARAFYARFGFEPSPSDPLHLILLIKDVAAAARVGTLPA